jgi:hypothetical protein
MTAVIRRRFPVLAATVGLWLSHSLAFAQEPSRLALNPGQTPPGANQQLADTIAAQLRLSGQLRHYSVDIRVEKGVVELTGQVADQTQREEVLRIVQGVPGVERVRDQMAVAAAVTPVTATTQPVPMEPRPLSSGDAFVPPHGGGMPAEPLPIFHAPPGAPGMAAPGVGHMPPPPMPPYAWPTYAPYNNYSRVAYPQLYPYQSWPFIGPMYPFPKVPLGWRSIQLKWMDGHWWYGRTATGHDWWRVRYW